MIGLAEKTLAELESLALEQRARILSDSQHSRAVLEDVEWKIEKRHWRGDSRQHSNRQGATNDTGTL